MTQVRDIVRDALGHLRVLDAAGNVSAIDMRDAIRALNMMMRRWEADGLAMGWSDVAEPTDNLPAPPEAEAAIGYNLAIQMRPRYGTAIDPDIIALAQGGLGALRRDVKVSSPMRFHDGGRYYNVRTDSYE